MKEIAVKLLIVFAVFVAWGKGKAKKLDIKIDDVQIIK